MTVAELIEKLKQYPPDAKVFTGDFCDDTIEAEGVSDYTGLLGEGVHIT